MAETPTPKRVITIYLTDDDRLTYEPMDVNDTPFRLMLRGRWHEQVGMYLNKKVYAVPRPPA